MALKINMAQNTAFHLHFFKQKNSRLSLLALRDLIFVGFFVAKILSPFNQSKENGSGKVCYVFIVVIQTSYRNIAFDSHFTKMFFRCTLFVKEAKYFFSSNQSLSHIFSLKF